MALDIEYSGVAHGTRMERHSGTTDAEVIAFQQAALDGKPFTIALAQPTKKLAGVAEHIYRNRRAMSEELARIFVSLRMTAMPLSGGLENPLNEYLARAIWARWWAHEGFNVFQLDEGLLSKFVLTDPPDIPIVDVMPPYHGFRIEIPPGILPIVSLEGNPRWVRWIDSFYMPGVDGGEHSAADKISPYAVIYSGLRVGDEPPTQGVFVLPRWTVWCYSDSLDVPGALYGVRPCYGITVGQFLGWRGDVPPEVAFGIEAEKASIQAAMRVVLNLCLALDAKAITPHKYSNKKREQHQKRGKVARPTTFYFDKSKVHVNLIDAARAAAHGNKAEEGWKVKSKFIVRGHWRNQACGPGRAEHKRIFIDPYWKGPDVTEGYAHLYQGADS